MHYAVLYGASHKLFVGSACAMWRLALSAYGLPKRFVYITRVQLMYECCDRIRVYPSIPICVALSVDAWLT